MVKPFWFLYVSIWDYCHVASVETKRQNVAISKVLLSDPQSFSTAL